MQVANIAVLDGLPTPVSHTLVPVSQQGMGAEWRDTVSNLPVTGQLTLEATRKRVNKSLEQVEIIVNLPALEAVTGGSSDGYVAAPKKAFDDRVRITFFQPVRSDVPKRKNLRVIVGNLILSNPQIIDLLDNMGSPL